MAGLELMDRISLSSEINATAIPFNFISDAMHGSPGTRTSYQGSLVDIDARKFGDTTDAFPDQESFNLWLKRTLDIVVSWTLLVMLSPIFLILTIMVRMDGGGAFYSHQRIGRNGVSFGCLKFRSMVTNSQERLDALLASSPAARSEWEASRKLKKDPRITWLGSFLRKSSMDELPQLLNVLRGDMSLVGPRPVTRSELEQHYGVASAHYKAVRPGITGVWQVSGRSDTSYQERVEMDVSYVSRQSFWGDMKILLLTPKAVFSRRGAC